MAIQIGKYKRPGIFIEEFNNSVIETPIIQGLSTMVIGFSRKGPVNNPVLLNNINDLERIFGPIDRNLEKKGSFFHRTIEKMLGSSPVYVMNLLATDDTLDLLEYKSLSTSTEYKNDVVRTGPYRRFFDTTGFWTRDSESFLNIVKVNPDANQRLLQFTNMSDKTITTFVIKSKLSGYDQTMVNYYEDVDKVPAFVYGNDLVSDYMVDVIVVSGDWSNYQVLAVDSKWGKYFSTSGLRKEQVLNFVNDRAVSILSFYEGLSLIPFFRDKTGRNIFIETVVNRDTNKTGLFCSFNSELLESDVPNGLIDLVGNNLISDSSVKDIEFLSYKDSIIEAVSYDNVHLDRVGNVTAIDELDTLRGISALDRTARFSEGYVNGLVSAMTHGTASVTVTYTANSAYAVISDKKVDIATGSTQFVIDPVVYVGVTSSVTSYSSTFVLDSTGVITKVDNTSNSNPVSIGANDIVLGQLIFDIIEVGGVNEVDDATLNDITVDASGFVEMVFGTDYDISVTTGGSITIEFLNTDAIPTTSNYAQYRRFKFFNRLLNLLDSPNKNKMTMLIDDNAKASLDGMTVTNIVTSTSANKQLTLNTNLSDTLLDDVADGNICFYTMDDEFVIGENGVVTKNTPATTTEGVAAKYSKFYTNYVDGIIQSSDYFYENILTEAYDISLISATGTGYIVFENGVLANVPDFQLNPNIIIPASVANKLTLTIVSPNNVAQSVLGYGAGVAVAYELSIQPTTEVLLSTEVIWNASVKHYLQSYLDGANRINVSFTDSLLESSEPINNLVINTTIVVKSQKLNYKQAVEIEVPAGYVQVANKILVSATRYTEVKNGDYLEAYVAPENDPFDSSYEIENGIPKRLTRITSKKLYAADTSLVEITTDARIKIYDFNGDLQTNRITTVDDYVLTYKALTLKGFKIRQDSMPDGSEVRQNRILNLVSAGTNLFKALTDKEAISFRYLVDSFGLGLTELSKQQLVDICGARLDVFGFINMPSMRHFKKSSSPTFVNQEGVLETKFINTGGDPESNPAFLYSFAEGSGASSVGYFTPYVIINDNGRPTEFPPASFAATTYMRKLNSNLTNVTPWTIAAGVNHGVITGIAGLEMKFNPEDIENLNMMQANPIVSKKNRGFVIETENTALTLSRSALSFIHVREVLIELENELGAMLLNYQWKYNTVDVRAEIKLKADTICERFVNRNGLYNFFNKMDEENNTSEIIDNQIGVLDTYVEPIKGMGVIVNNITVLRTGAINSGGFENV